MGSKRFGEFIRQRREELELKQAELAKRMDLSPTTIAYLESGSRGCDLDHLPKLAAAINVDPRKLGQLYLEERYPALYRILFPDPSVWENPTHSYPVIEDLYWRLERLPRRERGIVETLIYALFDLTKPKAQGGEDED